MTRKYDCHKYDVAFSILTSNEFEMILQIMEVPGLEEVEEEEEEEEEESPGEMRHLQTVQCYMMARSDNLGRGRGRRHGRRRRRHRPRRPPQLLALPPPPPPPRSHASGECSCN
jgi:hypothetical protein